MPVVLDLKPKTEEMLRKAVRIRGIETNDYIESLIERDAGFLSMEERLAPMRKQFEESRMTEEELDEFFDEVRQKAFEERFPNGRP